MGGYSFVSYYNYIIIISWFALFVLSILVFENDRMTVKEKRFLYFTYIIVALAALSEWLGLVLNGDTETPVWALRIVKCADYVLTPIAGGALVGQLHNRTKIQKLIVILLIANVVFQIVSLFTGWMLTIDSNNRYSHGPLYIIYMVLYLLIILLALLEFIFYGKKFRNQNKASLYLAIAMTLLGIVLQEISGGEYRTAYLAIAFSMAMMYIHNAEFVQLTTDDSLREKRIKLMLSQIRPHFINNSLSCISSLCETDPQRAREMTDAFADYLRAQLDGLEGEHLLSFEKVLEQIGFYVKLEQARFGDRLKVVYDIRAKDFQLPTMTLQPLVENAIRHGICKKEEGGTVWISSYETEEAFIIQVRDDGVGFNTLPANGTRSHIGIKNVRGRLGFYGNRMEIKSEIGVGTTVRIEVPKTLKREKKSI